MLCNHLQNVVATTYIFRLQLSTFIFYNKQRFVDEEDLLAIDGIDDTDLCYMYAPNSESETWTTFDGTIPEAAFGQVISKLYAVVVTDDGTESKCAAYAYSKGTVHSWGGTKNITFALNEDGKTVSVYTIYMNETATKIPSSIKVNGKSYKVTSIGAYANGANSGSSDHAFRYELIRFSGCN